MLKKNSMLQIVIIAKVPPNKSRFVVILYADLKCNAEAKLSFAALAMHKNILRYNIVNEKKKTSQKYFG